jgi:LmbE family N-acetylglucosaminyl deacetylase
LRPLSLERDPGAPLRILCLGAHSDDIEIGCGAAMLTLLARHPGSSVRWVVFSGSDARAAEARASAADFLARAEERDVRTLAFRESFFPSQHAEIKLACEALTDFAPDVVFTHRGVDRHQDHRTIAELTWNTFRNHLVLEYEIPKYDADLASPNAFVAVPDAVARQKCQLLRKHFVSQHSRPWFDEELFLGLMRIRGVECRSESGYAEAFDARKLVIA